jgi:NAD(P)-dependent dehydrogenase (short-subunit alcohol dehydrogenase family)
MESAAVTLIVGGSGGIGSALARRLRARGERVVVAGRSEAALAEVAAETGAEAEVVDAAQSASVDALVESVLKRHGRLDGVAHCVGSILLKPAHLTSDEEFAEAVHRNLTSAFFVLRAAVRGMMRQSGGGSVVLCSSVAAQRGLMNHEAIAAAKAGVEGLVLSAAATYARSGVRINAVAPGLTRTGLTRGLTQNEAMLKASSAMHPLGRIGEASEVASAIAWLLDREQAWVTGQILGVDGGMGRVQARG